MQHPVGVVYNPQTKRAELESIWAVLTNPTTLAAFPHTVTGAFVTAATFVAGIAGWWAVEHMRAGRTEEAAAYRPALRLGLVTLMIAGVMVAVTGDLQAKMMFEQQPMKMAAAEALCDTEQAAGFSVFAVGDVANSCDVRTLSIPGLTAFLATSDPNATIQGVDELQEEYQAAYGPGDYKPLLAVTYWSFRLMIGFGAFSALLGLAGLWLTRKGSTPSSKRFSWLARLALPMPFLASITGWIFTELGRQPWIVAPDPTGNLEVRMLTADGVSPIVDAPTVIVSLVVFTLLYGSLAVVWFGLMRRYASEGAPQVRPPDDPGDTPSDDAPLAFAY
jgi:cytochrome d ubiquinol oxidase subunit I